MFFQGDDVFWTNASGIWSTAKDGSSKPKQVVDSPSVAYGRVGVGPRGVYWVDAATLQLLSCPLDGCGEAEPQVIVSSGADKGTPRADESGVFWLEGQNREVHYCPFTGCSEPLVLTVGGASGAFAIDSRYLYWVHRDDSGFGQNIVRRLKPAP